MIETAATPWADARSRCWPDPTGVEPATTRPMRSTGASKTSAAPVLTRRSVTIYLEVDRRAVHQYHAVRKVLTARSVGRSDGKSENPTRDRVGFSASKDLVV